MARKSRKVKSVRTIRPEANEPIRTVRLENHEPVRIVKSENQESIRTIEVREVQKPFVLRHMLALNGKTFPPGSYCVGEKYNGVKITKDIRDTLIHQDTAISAMEREEQTKGLGRFIIHTPDNLSSPDGVRGTLQTVTPSEFMNKYAKDFGLG